MLRGVEDRKVVREVFATERMNLNAFELKLLSNSFFYNKKIIICNPVQSLPLSYQTFLRIRAFFEEVYKSRK